MPTGDVLGVHVSNSHKPRGSRCSCVVLQGHKNDVEGTHNGNNAQVVSAVKFPKVQFRRAVFLGGIRKIRSTTSCVLVCHQGTSKDSNVPVKTSASPLTDPPVYHGVGHHEAGVQALCSVFAAHASVITTSQACLLRLLRCCDLARPNIH